MHLRSLLVPLLAAVLLPLAPGPAAATDEGLDRAALVAVAESGLAADRSTRTYGRHDGAPTTKACYGEERQSLDDGTFLDAAQYGAFYGCLSAGEWLFPVTTYDTFSPSQLRSFDVRLDADGDGRTGCGGFEWTVTGYWSVAQERLEAAVLRTPACDPSGWAYSAPADIQMPGPQDVGLLFRNADVGGSGTVRWYAELRASADAVAERLPPSGVHTETGYLAASTSCSTAQSRRWYATTDDVAALRAAGASDLAVTRSGLTRFTGDPVRAQAALKAVDPQAVVRPDDGLRLAAAPRDPDLGTQWNLEQVRAAAAWDITRGSRSVVVAVIDTGADFTHPDLRGKLTGGYDAVRRTAITGGNADTVGHGTAVAGVIGASTDDGVGLASLGWETLVMPIKVDDDAGRLSTSAVIDAIYWAADRGAKVINLSLGGCQRESRLSAALQYAISKGALPVAAAGNEALEGNPVEYPAADAGVLAVGATGRDLNRARYSNFGAYVDLVAPGGSADGRSENDLPLLQRGGGTMRAAGSSFSAPLVSATAALVLSREPALRPAELTSRLLRSSRDLGPVGRDDEYGAGLLDAAAALTATPQASAAPSATPTASAAPAPAGPPLVPTLAVSPGTVDAGTAVRVSGRAEPGAQLELLAYSRPSTTYAVVRRAVTSDGAYAFQVTPGTNTRLYLRSTTSGGSADSTSAVIDVRSRVSLTVARTGTRTYRFSGSVLPRRGGVRISIYRGSVLSSSAVSTASDGTYAVLRTFTGTGTFPFTARAAASGNNAAGASRPVTVTVR